MAGINSFPTSSTFTINNPDWTTNREKVSQHQIPIGIRSSLNDKIFVPVTSSRLADNDSVLSPFVSVQQKIYNQQRNPNVKYLEAAFSPQDQINNDIVDQLGFFNIGQYIGDPRQWKLPTNNYPDLDKLRDQYFTKYTKNYNLVDFIRLMRFFDTSLFKMIKDFVPADVALSAGVVVKQHLLERNRVRPVQLTVTEHDYSGSIDTAFFSGGAGGSFNRYQGDKPKFNLTQSWSEIVQTLDGPVTRTYSDESEFYDGVFGNPSQDDMAHIDAIDGNGGSDCSRFYNPTYEDSRVTPVFLSTNNFTEEEFLRASTVPARGIVWLWHDGTNVQHIKVASKTLSGTDISRELAAATSVPILLHNPSTTPFPNLTPINTGFYTWVVLETRVFDDYVYYAPNIPLSPTIVYSEDANIFDIDFSATGDMIWYASASGTPATPLRLSGIGASIPQGFFPNTTAYPTEQFFRGWDGATYLLDYNTYIDTRGTENDINGNFDIGEREISTAVTSSEQSVYGRYTEQSTIPWFMDAPQTTRSFSETTIQDLDPVGPRNIEVVAIILTAITANCSTINTGFPANVIAVRYEGNEDLFTTNAVGEIILREGTNGFAVDRDLELFDVSQPGIIWRSGTIIAPASTPVNLPSGNYGVFPTSAENNDRILLQLGPVNGRQSVEIISYCP